MVATRRIRSYGKELDENSVLPHVSISKNLFLRAQKKVDMHGFPVDRTNKTPRDSPEPGHIQCFLVSEVLIAVQTMNSGIVIASRQESRCITTLPEVVFNT